MVSNEWSCCWSPFKLFKSLYYLAMLMFGQNYNVLFNEIHSILTEFKSNELK